MFKKRNQLRKSKDEKWDCIRKLNADKSAEFAKFKQEMEEEKKKRAEEDRLHREEEKRRKRKENAESNWQTLPCLLSPPRSPQSTISSYFDLAM